MVPRDVVVKHRRKQAQDAIARLKYEIAHPGRSHHNALNERHKRDMTWLEKPFVMWDGEGPQDAGYALFGNSDGYEICHPFLETEECLELILDHRTANPDAIHFWFGGNYDASMILRELPHRHLRMLHDFTRTVWNGWEIEHIPHKWFKVKRGNVGCKIYDVFSFFTTSYLRALENFKIGTQAERDRIAQGKASREIFMWSEIEEIKEYWKLELKLGPPLMTALRDVFRDAGYVPRSWHGPGALARMALKRHKVYDAMAKTPVDVQIAAQYAFAGGRFELFQAGHIQGRVYNADINSAYPHFATKLPNLNRGKWRHVRHYTPDRFGVYHIRYATQPDNSRAFPLFRRLPNGSVVWPSNTEGWYWNPEAELVKDDPDAAFLEGWIFEETDSTDRPFAWLSEYYDKRKRLKNAGSAAEYTFKLIINSVYGQLAQRAGWNRKDHTAPRSHQLEWAGYITSACRAEVYRKAAACGSKLISIDTDGIYSATPIPGCDTGKRLGQWETTEYTDGIFWQSGIYCLQSDLGYPAHLDYGWDKARTRGIKKGSYTIDELRACVYEGRTLNLARNTFVTYGLAGQRGWHLHNMWISEPHVYEMGGGKRLHWPRACKNLCEPPVHRLCQWEPTYGLHVDSDPWSRKHHLPWKDPPDDTKNLMGDMEIFDANHLDESDRWVLNYEHDGNQEG